MSLLFFDFETTNRADFQKRASDPSQPHLVQLAAMMTDDEGQEVELHKVIVKPDGWTIPDETAAIHGITTEFALNYGVPEKFATEIILDMLRRATLSVAHNHQFDKFIARIAGRWFGLLSDEQNDWWKALPAFCTMKQMTDVCGIPGTYGRYKWPKLSEAYFHATGKQLEGAHDALVDLRACKEVYFWHRKHSPIV